MSGLLAIVPVLNLWETYTRPMLQSLTADHPLSVLIIDNGSDGSGERAHEMADHFRSIDVIRNGVNRGVGASWNQGIRWGLANGYDRFLILNNDIVVHPAAIDALERVFDRDGVYLASMHDVAGELGSAAGILRVPPKPPVTATAPNFSAFIIGTKTLDAMVAAGDPLLGFFDESFSPAYFEDNDYHYRMKLYLGEASAIVTTDAMFYHYGSRTQNQAQSVPVVSGSRFEQNRAYYVKKWGGTPGRERFRRPFDE